MTEEVETHAAESRASKECGENCDVEEKRGWRTDQTGRISPQRRERK